jgi:hypothetical protein
VIVLVKEVSIPAVSAAMRIRIASNWSKMAFVFFVRLRSHGGGWTPTKTFARVVCYAVVEDDDDEDGVVVVVEGVV